MTNSLEPLEEFKEWTRANPSPAHWFLLAYACYVTQDTDGLREAAGSCVNFSYSRTDIEAIRAATSNSLFDRDINWNLLLWAVDLKSYDLAIDLCNWIDPKGNTYYTSYTDLLRDGDGYLITVLKSDQSLYRHKNYDPFLANIPKDFFSNH